MRLWSRGQEPRLDAVAGVQVAFALAGIDCYSGCHVCHLLLITKLLRLDGAEPRPTDTTYGVACGHAGIIATGSPVCGWVSDLTYATSALSCSSLICP